MEKGIKLGASILMIALIVVGFGLLIMLMTGDYPDPKLDKLPNVSEVDLEKNAAKAKVLNKDVGLSISLTTVILYLAGGLAVLSMIMSFFTSSLKKVVPGLIGFAVLAVIMLVCYNMGDTSLPAKLDPKIVANISETEIKLSDASIYAVAVFLGLTVLAAIGSEVMRIFR